MDAELTDAEQMNPESLDTLRWIHGSPSARRNTDPLIQVHRHDPIF
jgi:hypothetical protein